MVKYIKPKSLYNNSCTQSKARHFYSECNSQLASTTEMYKFFSVVNIFENLIIKMGKTVDAISTRCHWYLKPLMKRFWSSQSQVKVPVLSGEIWQWVPVNRNFKITDNKSNIDKNKSIFHQKSFLNKPQSICDAQRHDRWS
jgi:hypothetical protein